MNFLKIAMVAAFAILMVGWHYVVKFIYSGYGILGLAPVFVAVIAWALWEDSRNGIFFGRRPAKSKPDDKGINPLDIRE